MNIVLIRPRPLPETIGLQHVMICEPLELEYICSAIADLGHRVTIYDMILERDDLATIIEREQPDLVGLTAYIAHVGLVTSYCEIIKRLVPACLTVVGGVHAEVVPSDFLHPCIDVVVEADALNTFRGLVVATEAGRPRDNLAGVWREGQRRAAKSASFNHPHPARDKVARYRHRYYYLFHNPCALIKTSFGCPYDCSFCFCREVTGGQYYERDLADVISELSQLQERDIYIVDDNFLFSRERILAFCEQLEKHAIDKRFLVYGRADFIAANADVIERFKSCGLRAVIVGLESCRESTLDQYNKRTTLAENERAVAVLREHDVDCYATLILGLDWGPADFRSLGQWLRKLKLTFVNLQPFTPLPGTAPFEAYEGRLSVPVTDYAKWDLAHLVVAPTGMSEVRYYWEIIRLYYQVSMRPCNSVALLRKYGLRQNLRLAAGASRVTLQYVKRMWHARGRR